MATVTYLMWVVSDNREFNKLENVTIQKVELAGQLMCACAVYLCTFLCRPLQNNREFKQSTTATAMGTSLLNFF